MCTPANPCVPPRPQPPPCAPPVAQTDPAEQSPFPGDRPLCPKCVCRWSKPQTCRTHGPLPSPGVYELCEVFMLPDRKLRKVRDLLSREIANGLKKSTHEKSTVKSFPTFIQDLPSRCERGKYLALDLGGTRLRCLLVTILLGKVTEEREAYEVTEEAKKGTIEELFDYITDCLYKFVLKYNVDKEEMSLGFVFSFPVVQVSLTEGYLAAWTKGYDLQDGPGMDVCQLFQEAIDRQGQLKVKVKALINDTAGALISCAWEDHYCRIGVILSTGTNACYVEKQENSEFFDDEDGGSGFVLINTEWGNFGSDGKLKFIRTEFDKKIDETSCHQGKQIFEKMISALYLGEMVRLTILKLVQGKNLFGGACSKSLCEPETFTPEYITEIESEPRGTYVAIKKILENLGICGPSEQDCVNVRFICEVVTSRAASLAAAGICALMNRLDENRITVGIHGSLYKWHPQFHNRLVRVVRRLKDEKFKVKLRRTEGCGYGAAIAVATIERLAACRKNRKANKRKKSA